MIEPVNCPGCEMERRRADAERRRADAIQVDLENAETELRVGRRRETTLRAELRTLREEEEGAEQIKEVLAEWKILCGHQRAKTPLDGARAKAVRRMLKANFSPEQLKTAIRGAARFPFVGPQGRSATGTPKQRHDDLALILRDETTVERFISYAEREDEPAGEVVSLQLRGGPVVAKALLDEAVETIVTLRRVIQLQRDMIALEARFNDRAVAELGGVSECAA